MRALVGTRLAVFAVGLNAAAAGAVLALGHLSLRHPSPRNAFRNPELNTLEYDVPRWMLGVGIGMFAVGVAFVLAAWYSSPRWVEGPLHRFWGPTLLSWVFTGWCTSVVVAVLGRDSGELRGWVVFIVVSPIATAIGLLVFQHRTRP